MMRILLLQGIIIFLLATLIITHRKKNSTPTIPPLGNLPLEKALETMINAGFLPGGVAEVLRYLSLKRQKDKYPGWLISLHTTVQCASGTFTSTVRGAITSRWKKISLQKVVEDFLNLLPTSQTITGRIRREKLEDIRRAIRQLFASQWEKHGRKAMRGEVDIILDRTQKQVWPKTKKGRRKETMEKWVMAKGREKHLCLATLMATDGNLNLFLKIDPVTPLKNSPFDEVKRDLDYTLKLNIKVRYVLLDRGYGDGDIRIHLAEKTRRGKIGGFVQPAVKTTAVKRRILEAALKGQEILIEPREGKLYYLVVERVGEVKPKDVDKLRQLSREALHWMLVGFRGGGKRLKIEKYGKSPSEAKEKLKKEYLPALNRVIEAYHAWYMTEGLWREGLHRELYRGRWRIENGHRDKGFFWGKTKSSSLKARLYFAAVSFALYNAWQLERRGAEGVRAVEMAAHLSHTFECLSLILLREALNTFVKALLRLFSEASWAAGASPPVSCEDLQALLWEQPLYCYLFKVVVEGGPPPPKLPVERVVVGAT
jgi:hypothetical protein